MMRWILGVALALAVALGAGVFFGRDRLAMALMERVAADGMAGTRVDGLGPGLHAAFCGTGSPFPDRDRAGPCLAVIAEGRLFVFDAGDGAAETLTLMGLPPGRIEAAFVTHLHSDHIDGLGGLALQRWAGGGADTPLTLFGPPGVERVAAGFNEAYAIDSTYRLAHHGADVVPPSGFGLSARPFAKPAAGLETLVHEAGGVRIVAIAVDHGPVDPAVGYRIEAGGRSIVISGDTNRSASLEAAAKGADLLVHDSLSPELTSVLVRAAEEAGDQRLAKIFADIQNYHASPSDVVDLATAAGVGAVALTHQVPPLRTRFFEGPFLAGADKRFDGPLYVARDGDLLTVGPNGAVRRSRLMR